MPPKRKPEAMGRPDDVFVHEPSDDLDGSWPVTHTEDFHTQDVILAPGPTLQQCSGADVMLAKGASLKPNLTKGKGRFLIVLPGMLSIKAQGGQKKDSKLPDADVAAAADTVVDPTQDTEVSSTTPEEPTSDALPVEATKPNPRHIFGTISGLATDTPKLTVTLPHSQQLVFMGRKIDTSSRFMMLTCHARKSSVLCKDSVQSLIVFGKTALVDTTASSTSVELSDASPADQDASFRHYGGSMRAYDGGKPGHKSLSRVVERTPKAADDMLLEEEESDEEIPDGGHDSDDYVQAIKSSVEPKVRSRRSTSERKITYTQESEEDEESEDNEQSDEADAPPKKRARPSGGKKPAAIMEVVDEQEKKLPAKKPVRKAVAVDEANAVKPIASEVEDDEEDQEQETQRLSKSAPKPKKPVDDDDESFGEGIAIENTAPKRRAPRRITTTTKKVVVELTGEEESEEDNVPPKKPAPKKRRVKAAPSKTKTFELDEDDDDELDEVKAPPKKKRRRAKKSVENEGYDSFNEAVEPEDDEAQQKMKPAPRKSRGPKKKLVMDPDNHGGNDDDDEGNDFNDEPVKTAPKRRVSRKSTVVVKKIPSPDLDAHTDLAIEHSPVKGGDDEEDYEKNSKRKSARQSSGSAKTTPESDAKKRAPVQRKPPAKAGGEPKKTPIRRKTPAKTAILKAPSSNGSKQLPIDVLDEFDDSSPAKTSSVKKIGSPSPRTKSGRRKTYMSLAEAVVDVDDCDDWKLGEKSD